MSERQESIAHSLYTSQAAYCIRAVHQTEPAYSLGRSSSPQERTLDCSHTAAALCGLHRYARAERLPLLAPEKAFACKIIQVAAWVKLRACV